MKCVRLNLSERARIVRGDHQHNCTGATAPSLHPRRYCQKLLVNPDHDEDPRWTEAALERFRFSIIPEEEDTSEDNEHHDNHDENEELFLSVLNLKFPGDFQLRKRPRTCFKYKSGNDNNIHRMFIKQTIEDNDNDVEESRLSVDSNLYYDDYVKHIINRTDQSRPSTGKSSLFQRFDAGYIAKENKAIQVDTNQNSVEKSINKINESKTIFIKKIVKKPTNMKKNECSESVSNDIPEIDTKICFHNTGKRKSLTISRAQSPETVQVIRVDVVCNNLSSVSSSISVNAESCHSEYTKNFFKNDAKITTFANKYLLTNTIKSLDENVCGGSKVTLLCKTFRLADRLIPSNKINKSKLQPKIQKVCTSKQNNNIKSKFK